MSVRAQWLISYGDDPDVGLLWHEIRPLNDEERKALGDKLTAAGIPWSMLNLTSIRHVVTHTIEEYIQARKAVTPQQARVSAEAVVKLVAKWRKAATKSRAYLNRTSDKEIEWCTELETNMRDLEMCADELEAALATAPPEQDNGVAQEEAQLLARYDKALQAQPQAAWIALAEKWNKLAATLDHGVRKRTLSDCAEELSEYLETQFGALNRQKVCASALGEVMPAKVDGLKRPSDKATLSDRVDAQQVDVGHDEQIIEIDEDGKVHGDISGLKPDQPQAASAGALSAEQVKDAVDRSGGYTNFIPMLTNRLNALLAAHDQKVRERRDGGDRHENHIYDNPAGTDIWNREGIMPGETCRLCQCEEELKEEQSTHEEIGSLCFAAGASTPDGTSIGAVRDLISKFQKVRAEVLEEAMLEEMAMYIALRLPEGLPLRGDRNEAKHVILRLMRAAALATAPPEQAAPVEYETDFTGGSCADGRPKK